MKKIVFVLFLIIYGQNAFSQAQFSNERERWKSGSVYSYFGVGMPNHFYSSQAAGMGIQGVSLYNPYSNNGSNPALWGYPVFTTGVASLYVNTYDAKDSNQKAAYTNVGIGSAQVLFPVERNRLGLNISLQPYSTVGYRIQTENVIAAGALLSDADVSYLTEQRGVGGLNKLEAGIGFGITKGLSVGIAPSLVFGLIERENEIAFDTLLFQNVEFKNRETLRGFGARAGLMANTSSIFKEEDNISFGLSYELSTTVDFKERLYTRYLADEVELPTRTDAQQTIPAKLTAGLAYRPSNWFLLSGEVSHQGWGNYNDVGSLDQVSFVDQTTLGLGAELMIKNRRDNKFLTQLIYRGGLSHDSGYLKFGGQNISTTSIHGGFGIPSRFTSSSIDINFSYGVRGPGGNDFVTEKIFLTRISFNLSEPMFIRRKLQ